MLLKQYKVRNVEKIRNRYIHIITVTLSGVLYQVEWMRPYHWITRDAKLCFEGDPTIWLHPPDVILYAKSHYCYNMFIIYPFSDIILIL